MMFRSLNFADARLRLADVQRILVMRIGFLVVVLAVLVLFFWGYNVHRAANPTVGGYEHALHDPPPPLPLDSDAREVGPAGGSGAYGEIYTYSHLERRDPFRPLEGGGSVAVEAVGEGDGVVGGR